MGEIIALLGLLVSIAGMIGGAVWLLHSKLTSGHDDLKGQFSKGHGELKVEMGLLKTEMGNVSSRIDTLERDNYTKPEAEAHALRLALNNPHLKVPDPRNPARLLHVGDQPQEPQS